MRSFGVFIVSSMGGLGMAMSAALLRQFICRGPEKAGIAIEENRSNVVEIKNEASIDDKVLAGDFDKSSSTRLNDENKGNGDVLQNFNVHAVESNVCSFAENVPSTKDDQLEASGLGSDMLSQAIREETTTLTCKAYNSSVWEDGMDVNESLSNDETILHVEEYVLESPQLSPTKSISTSSTNDTFEHISSCERDETEHRDTQISSPENKTPLPESLTSSIAEEDTASKIRQPMHPTAEIPEIRDEYEDDEFSIQRESEWHQHNTGSKNRLSADEPKVSDLIPNKTTETAAPTLPSGASVNEKEETRFVRASTPLGQVGEKGKLLVPETTGVPLNNLLTSHDAVVHDTLHVTEVDLFAHSRQNQTSPPLGETQNITPVKTANITRAESTKVPSSSLHIERRKSQTVVFNTSTEHSKENERPAMLTRSVSQKIKRAFGSRHTSRVDDRRRSMRLTFTSLRGIRRNKK